MQEIPFQDPAEVFAAFAHRPYALFFDSVDRGRYSYIAVDPHDIITDLDTLQTRLREEKTPAIPGLPPFQGGAAGFFSYELARTLENIPVAAADDMYFPDMAVGLYRNVIAFDLTEKRAWVFGSFPALPPLPPKGGEGGARGEIVWTPNFSENAYKIAVQKVIDYIHAGDVFQVNLSQRFAANLPPGFDGWAFYRVLRQTNPAPFAAYMNFGDFQIASSSPERFLKLSGSHVETRPIKGTCPRGNTPREDLLLAEKLLASEKDRAENAMIVDLLRNDLSRVCELHSIKVPELCTLESYASVHHLVSTVEGALRPDCDAVDLLKAAFPGGSVTGAPKIRAMEIIAEIEPMRRGPYCGAMGWIGFNGDMDTNIAIRTLCFKNGHAVFHAGGGITAQSDPQAEYDETLTKAQALFRAFVAPAKVA